MAEYLVVGHISMIVTSLVTLFARFKKLNSNIALNYSTYLLVFAVFYFCVPALITTVTKTSLVGSSQSTIEYASLSALYFTIVFFIFFYFSTRKATHTFNIRNDASWSFNLIPLTFAVLIGFYVLFFLIKDAAYLIEIYNNRRLQADYDNYLIQVFKVYFFSKFQLMCIAFLVLTTKNLKYFALFTPFLMLDILLSGRDLIFSFIIVMTLMYGFLQKRVYIRYLMIILSLLILMGVLRSNAVLEWSDFAMVLGEFSMTWSTTHLIIDSDIINDWKALFVFSILKIFPLGLYEIFFGEYVHYHAVITNDNPFAWGLSGSVISEALSFKSNFLLILTPFIICIYGWLINFLLRINTISTKIVFIMAIVHIHPLIRFTFYEHIMYPFYLIIFFGFWIIFYDFKRYQR
jgi:hypothetical protein